MPINSISIKSNETPLDNNRAKKETLSLKESIKKICSQSLLGAVKSERGISCHNGGMIFSGFSTIERGTKCVKMAHNVTAALSGKRKPVPNLLYGESFKSVAKKYNVILGVRAPNPLGMSLLKAGLPSKNFHMKAKSSPTGPTAGYITEDPVYSKVSPSNYKKQDATIEKAKSMGAKVVELSISEERKKELIVSGNMISLGNDMYSAEYPGGKKIFIIENDGRVLDSQKKPVMVMTNPPEIGCAEDSNKPITADYDLFTIIPHKNQSINQRPLLSRPKLIRGNFNLDFVKPKSINGQSEDVNMGNLHHFGKVIVTSLNKEIKNEGYDGGKLVWHNDETGNPFSPGFDINDKPIYFLPSGEIVQVESLQQLKDLYSNLKDKGYTPEYSPIFGF